MGRIWLTSLALLLAAPGAASSNQPPPPPLSDEQVVALVSRDERMTVPVRIADAGPWPFIVDTGAQRTVISRELANVLKLAPGRDVRVIAMSGTAQSGTAIIPSLSVSTIGGTAIEAPALAAQHLGAPGLLGIDTLQDKKVAIDFAAQTMTVSPSQRRPGGGGPARPDEVVVRARSYLGQLVIADASYRDRPIRVVLDTGTAVSVGNPALRRLFGPLKEAPVTMTSAIGGQLAAQGAVVSGVTVGSVEIDNLPIAFADAEPFRQFRLQKRPALMLGMDALSLFRRVEIDFANRELRLIGLRGLAVVDQLR